MKDLYILIGNIGSGKSTYIRKTFDGDFGVFCKDSLRYDLGYYKYDDTERYIFDPKIEGVIDKSMKSSLELHMYCNISPLIIDETNMTIKTRAPYIEFGKKYGYDIIAIVFPTLYVDSAVERRKNDTLRGYSEHMWVDIWEDKHIRYEEATLHEGFDQIIELSKDEIGV